MSEHHLLQELARLRARAATLEQLLEVHEHTVLEQSARLEASLAELRERAAELEQSEEAHRHQRELLQLVLDNIADGVVVVDENGKFLLFNPAAEEILGQGALDTVPADWTRDYGLLLPDQVTPFPVEQLPLTRAMRGEMVNRSQIFVRHPGRPKGTWLSVNARPLRDEAGRARGAVAVFRNISARKHAEQRAAAQLAVTRVLAESATLAIATPRILEAICTSVGWDIGAIWHVDRSAGVLRCVDVWHVPDHAFPEFEERTRSITFVPGVGLPGRVWADREAVWVPDVVQDANFPRWPVAARAGLHGAVAFPILFNQEITGVLEFFSRQVRQPDNDFLTMLAGLGSQIGQFIERKRAEEDLRLSRERFELAVLGSRDGLWDWDVKANKVYHSPRWKSMLGIAPGEEADPLTEWESRLHPDDRLKAVAAIDDYLAGRTSIYEVEYRLRHNDGNYRWILDRGVALFDLNNQPYRMAGSHTDITERKAMEQELRDAEALYHSLVETLPLAIFRKDTEGRYTFCNQRFCAAMERPVEKILGKTDFDLAPPDAAERFRALDMQALETGDIVEVIDEHRRSDGEQVFVHLLKAPFRDAEGNLLGVQGMFWDVTAHQKAKRELERAKETAEAASRAKSQFLANVSHEIRTPMNGIIGMTELALDTELTLVQREYLSLVKSSADSLLGVINDILDYSKIEAGKLDLDLQEFSLRDTLGDTLRTLAARAHKKNLELACHIRPEVPDALIGDPVRLRQIVINLVGNAIKFTQQGEIVVGVEIEEPPAGGEAHLHVTVRDTGIGISASKHGVIFHAFEQADGSTTRRFGGTGLGLAIAARLVEMMCGRIWVESALGRGSCFHFTAMFGLQPEPALHQQPKPPRDLRDLPVLIVDDNATNRMILKQTLESWHMKPACADSGQAALGLLHAARDAGEPFALVLLDAHMPEMDGFDLAARIQERADLAPATLMMLTSGGHPGDVQRCRELGIVSYLLKPVKQSDLFDGIVTALGSAAFSVRPQPVTPAENTPRRRLHILVAEDNAVNQRLMIELLGKRGHSVVIAGNGKEVIDLVERQNFDLLLMDVQMPEMDGFEATVALRRREQNGGRHLPIIAMTAHAMKGDRERCLAAGMDGYISKPIQAAELWSIIEKNDGARGNGVEPSPAGLDLKRALAHTGGDEEILRNVIEVFLREWPKWQADFRRALSDAAVADVRRVAHTTKGSLNLLGAASAFETAEQLEMLGRDGNLAGAAEIYSRLEHQIEDLRSALTAYLGGATVH
jgi:two-component system sensor histidine kinase/response regulator